MTELRDNIFAIEVPEDTIPDEWNIFNIDGNNYLNGLTTDGTMYAGTKPLPPGSYEILFTTKGVTEEQAKRVVPFVFGNQSQRYEAGYWDYRLTDDRNAVTVDTATESLQSLLKSKGLSAENYLIIKKVD